MILKEGQIRAQVSSIRKRSKRPHMAFALRAEGSWSGSPRLNVDGIAHRVAFCRSDLELRERLRESSLAGEPLIALCPFSSATLGEDVLARIAKRRVLDPDDEEILKSLFLATSIDPRVMATTPLMQGLVDHAPPDDYPPVPGGVLDLQTAWGQLLRQLTGQDDVAGSIVGFLAATLDAGTCSRIDAMSADLKAKFFSWAGLNLDPSAAWMKHLVLAKKTADLVPFGLLLEVIFENSEKTNAEIAAARVRLESWFSNQTIDTSAARTWAAGSRTVIQGLSQRPGSNSPASAILARGDELLSEFKVTTLAMNSGFSPAGFEQRLRLFARQLTQCAKSDTAGGTETERLVAAIDSLRRHHLAADNARRVERCQMATRLVGWLTSTAAARNAGSLAGLIEMYMHVGGFVDWARSIVQEGDSDPVLNKAFEAVLARAATICGAFEADFAAKLAEWTAQGGPPVPGYIPIEDALDKAVGPIGAQAPVLLLVMDGMNVAVFRELLGDIVQRGNWLECSPALADFPGALLTTVPSITEVSRRALLRGRLHPESVPTKKSAFAGNDRLFSQCGGQNRPILFLKGDLQAAGEAGLSEDVANAIANKKCRVVATVLNAVDDHLTGSDQIAPRWDLDYVRPLREMLQLAAQAGRILILTSDHGHVLDHNKTTLRNGMTIGGDRYREDGGGPGEGEISISGTRVQQSIGSGTVTAAWSPTIRYAGKKRGYHGGVSPQEIVVPFAVFRHLGSKAPAGWTDVTPSPLLPEWWHLTPRPKAEGAVAAIGDAAAMRQTAGLELFVHAAKEQPEKWIEHVLDGAVYQAQSSRAVRGVPDREQVALFLEILSGRGGSMPKEMLAERLGLPLLRLAGHVSNLARVFNVDGYEVLRMDASSGTVVLNVPLLKKQFAVADQ